MSGKMACEVFLPPCPHCGGKIVGVGWGGDMCRVICRMCGASGQEKPTESEAKKAWADLCARGLS